MSLLEEKLLTYKKYLQSFDRIGTSRQAQRNGKTRGSATVVWSASTLIDRLLVLPPMKTWLWR